MTPLQSLLKQTNIKQKDIAKAIHVDPSLVSKWLKGKRTPSEAQLKALSAFFQVDLIHFDTKPIQFIPLSMDSIRIMDFKAYTKMHYHVFDILMLIIILIRPIFNLNDPMYILIFLSVSMITMMIQMKRIWSPPKRILSTHVQHKSIHHRYVLKTTFDKKFQYTQGMMYSMSLFIIEPIHLIIFYQITSAFADTLSTSILSIWFFIMLVLNGLQLLKSIIKTYHHEIIYHESNYRFKEGYGQLIKTSLIIQTCIIALVYMALDITHPYMTLSYILLGLTSFVGFLIHQQTLIDAEGYAFDFKI